jgi:hypothetical protein
MVAHERPFAVVKRISLEAIDAAVCARLGPARVAGNAQPAAFNRQVAMYLAKHVGEWSTTKIGKFYNGRDHSTVCHSIRRIEAMRDCNPDLDSLLAGLCTELRGVERTAPDGGKDGSAEALYSNLLAESFVDGLVERIADRVVMLIEARMSSRMVANRTSPA